MKIMITNIDTLNEFGISMSEFDDMPMNEKQNFDHILMSVEEFVAEMSNPDYDYYINPEYNIFTVINESEE